MKKLILIIAVFVFLGINTGNAQDADDPITVYGTYLEAWRDQNPVPEVRLRWTVDDYRLLQLANLSGFKIERITIANGSGLLSIKDQLRSVVVLDSMYLPRMNGSWTGFKDDQIADAARKLVYEGPPQNTGTSFKDAVDFESLQENRLFFTELIADQDFELAKAMAIGYTSNTLVEGEEYVFSVKINGEHPDYGRLAGVLNLGQDVDTQDPPPSELITESKEKSIVVGWNIEEAQNYYTAFKIERSVDGNNFKAVNNKPFIYVSDGEIDNKYAFYTDSVGSSGVKYFYRVRGMNIFGFYSEPSEVVEGFTRRPRMKFQLFIDSTETVDGKIFLGWERLGHEFSDSLMGYDIYFSEKTLGPYEKFNDKVINPSHRDYYVANPPRSAYYVLSSEDAYGNIYKSPAKFVQLVDSISPRVPRDLEGVAMDGDKVQISWSENQESDFDGYRIFRCLARGGAFATLHFDILKEASFEDDLQGFVLGDSVFYRVDAMDFNGNSSGPSKVLAVKRYDMTPPAAPTLYKAQPLPVGVAIAWRYSSSDDVVLHELQRKPAGGPGWETIVSVENYQRDQYVFEDTTQITATCYVDDEVLGRMSYDYQFIAYDGMGMATGSEIITVRPYDSGSRGTIESFDISSQCEQIIVPSEISPTLEADINDAIASFESNGSIGNGTKNGLRSDLVGEGFITSAESSGTWKNYSNQEFFDGLLLILENHGEKIRSGNCNVDLNWNYTIDPTVINFQIMKSRAGSAFRVYMTLPIDFFYPSGNVVNGTQSFSYSDTVIDPNVRYVYKVLAQHSDGGFSDLSSPLTVTPE